MQYSKADRVFHGWQVASIDICSSQFDMYTLSRTSQQDGLLQSLFVIPIHSLEQEITLQEQLSFYRMHNGTRGLVSVYGWSVKQEEDQRRMEVRCEALSCASFMRFDEKQSQNMALDLLSALETLRKNGYSDQRFGTCTIMRTQSGGFKMAGFLPVEPLEAQEGLHQDLASLAGCICTMLDSSRDISEAFCQVLIKAARQSYETPAQMEADLLAPSTPHTDRRRRHFPKSALKDLLASLLLVVIFALALSFGLIQPYNAVAPLASAARNHILQVSFTSSQMSTASQVLK